MLPSPGPSHLREFVARDGTTLEHARNREQTALAQARVRMSKERQDQVVALFSHQGAHGGFAQTIFGVVEIFHQGLIRDILRVDRFENGNR